METPIKITHYKETLDNWGRTNSSNKGVIIFSVLNDPDDFNDDMEFEDDNGKIYSIDDLIGKEVFLDGVGVFTVQSDDD